MARWRLTAWVREHPETRVRKHWQAGCKLCAIAKAMDIAGEVAKANHIAVGNVKWTAEKLTDVVGQWEIVFHDGQRIGTLPRRHGH